MYYLVLFGSAYSSTHTNQVNYNKTNFLADTWSEDGATNVSSARDIISLTTEGRSQNEMTSFIPAYPGDPEIVMHSLALAMLEVTELISEHMMRIKWHLLLTLSFLYLSLSGNDSNNHN